MPPREEQSTTTSEGDSVVEQEQSKEDAADWRDAIAEELGEVSETEGSEQEQETAPKQSVEKKSEKPTEKPAEKPAEELSDDVVSRVLSSEAAKRAIQSEADKRLDRFRREQEQRAIEAEAQRKAKDEEAEFDTLDDEEIGVRTRAARAEAKQQELVMQQAVEQARAIIGRTFTEAQNQMLAAVPDEKARTALLERVRADEFQDIASFQLAAAKEMAKAELAKALKDQEKQLREAIRNELAAQMAEDSAPPVVGTSRPLSSKQKFRQASPADQWQQALEEELGIK